MYDDSFVQFTCSPDPRSRERLDEAFSLLYDVPTAGRVGWLVASCASQEILWEVDTDWASLKPACTICSSSKH